MRGAACALAATLAACGTAERSAVVTDPIDGIPVQQQRAVGRRDFPRAWPLSVGGGTLGCVSGAVVFRHGGVNYALNDAARARNFADPDSLRLTEHRQPSNPLGRITQEQRMRVFAAAQRCRDDNCSQALQRAHGITSAEFAQINAEGRERKWPPLAADLRTLAPLTDAGLGLCGNR